MNIIKILYASLIGSLALIMMGSLWANDNRPTERSTKVNIQGYIFELYPPNTQAQIDIIEALTTHGVWMETHKRSCPAHHPCQLLILIAAIPSCSND